MVRFQHYLAAGTLVLSGILLLGATPLSGFGSTQNQPPPAGVKSSKFFKNIKILKDLPANQMIPVMQKVSASLGVKCDFCHDVKRTPGRPPTGFEKDTKKYKNIARKMMVMTQDLNKRHTVVEGKVTCFTCHHGRAEPDNTVPAPRPGR